jgi:hypothetical protein
MYKTEQPNFQRLTETATEKLRIGGMKSLRSGTEHKVNRTNLLKD